MASKSEEVIKLSDRRPEKPDPDKMNDAYKDMVMGKFEDMEHEANRAFKDKRAAVERKARQRL